MAVKVYLQFGPCQGTTKTLTNAQFASGQTTCKGATYKDTGGYIGRPPIHLFRYAAPSGGGGGDITGHATHAMQGWADLRRRFNSDLPRAVHKLARLNRGTLSELARHHRVRG